MQHFAVIAFSRPTSSLDTVIPCNCACGCGAMRCWVRWAFAGGPTRSSAMPSMGLQLWCAATS
eukprot:6857175-Prymnesium_polylepis.2